MTLRRTYLSTRQRHRFENAFVPEFWLLIRLSARLDIELRGWLMSLFDMAHLYACVPLDFIVGRRARTLVQRFRRLVNGSDTPKAVMDAPYGKTLRTRKRFLHVLAR